MAIRWVYRPTLLDAYRQGHDPEARLALLATYLGHVDPKHTYWYLSARDDVRYIAALPDIWRFTKSGKSLWAAQCSRYTANMPDTASAVFASIGRTGLSRS